MTDTNTKAVLIGVNEVALQILTNVKDGFVGEFEDFWTRFTTDAAFKAKLETAYNDAKAAQGELASLGYMDLFDLGQTQLSYVPRLVNALHNIPTPAPVPAPVAKLEAPVEPTPAA